MQAFNSFLAETERPNDIHLTCVYSETKRSRLLFRTIELSEARIHLKMVHHSSQLLKLRTGYLCASNMQWRDPKDRSRAGKGHPRQPKMFKKEWKKEERKEKKTDVVLLEKSKKLGVKRPAITATHVAVDSGCYSANGSGGDWLHSDNDIINELNIGSSHVINAIRCSQTLIEAICRFHTTKLLFAGNWKMILSPTFHTLHKQASIHSRLLKYISGDVSRCYRPVPTKPALANHANRGRLGLGKPPC